MFKKAIGIAGLLFAFLGYSYAQVIPQYGIKAQLDIDLNEIKVVEKIVFEHNESTPLEEIYLTDWNHAFNSTESPLAKRLVEEYTRSFYLSNKSKRGETIIDRLTINEKEVNWKRLDEQLDQLRIGLKEPLEARKPLRITIHYRIKLPDSKFTGYGVIDKNVYALENTFIRLARFYNGNWDPISHLDLEDYPGSSGDFSVEFHLPSGLKINSNLNLKQARFSENGAVYSFQAKKKKQLQFYIGDAFAFRLHKFGDKEVYSNLDNNDLSEGAMRYSLKKVIDYLHQNVGKYPHDRILIAQEKYNKRPFYGLTLIPDFLKPFPRQLEFEVKALNTYLYHYLYETLDLHPRKDYWLLGGLHTYLMMRYVEKHYPNQKLLELIMRQPIARFFLNKYKFKELKFNDTFIEFHEFILRRNLQQSLTTSKEELIKFNEQIGNPSQMGLLLYYFNEIKPFPLQDFFTDLQQSNYSGEQLQAKFYALFSEDKAKFIENYLQQRNTLDLRFKSFIQTKDSVSFTVAEKRNERPPFQIGWVKNDSLIAIQRFSAKNFDQRIKLPKNEADYLVINPKAKLPEFNPRNNWKKISGTGIKPMRFTFVKDLENPKYNQVFYNPRMNFNAYDGLSFGVRLNNKTIKSRPLIFTLEPFYASLEKSLVGSFATSYSKYNENSAYFLKQFNLAGSSFHYDTNLRYTSLASSFNVYKRADDLRNNRKELMNIFWQYVNRDQNSNTANSPNYNLAGVNYIISNKGALDYFTLNARFEAGTQFGKFNFTTEYRHLMRSGRQLSLRFFAGKFLWRNDLNTNFFDYALDRPTDYLFQYDYLGRSETTGIYSQQFIPAEGGFKSRFDQPLIDNFLMSINSSIGLWKWIELYGDLGYIDQKNQNSRVLFDTGFRFNLVPDFLELYFPVYNSNGLQIQGPRYHEKIRYVIVFDPQTLTQLFSRKWF